MKNVNPARIRSILSRLGLTLAVLAGLFAVPVQTVNAQSPCLPAVTVTSNVDSGAGTLRQAIDDVCTNGTITFDRSLSLATITLASVLTINKNMTIDGSTLTDQVTISGGGGTRVFYNSQILTLKSLKISDGSTTYGAGIYNTGTLTITNSTLSNNKATLNGGGIFNHSGLVNVINSTFSGNSSNNNGGAILNNGIMAVKNSTFTANGSVGFGSGISNFITLTVENSTFYGNIGSEDVFNFSNMTIKNTILAGSSGSDDCVNLGTISPDSKNNMIETDAIGVEHCAEAGDPSYIIGSDPLLSALANNGGPTKTNSLQAGSPAINAGDYATCLSVEGGKDQRSVVRADASGLCDIGAFEVGTYLTPEVSSSTPAMGDVLVTSPTTLTVVFNKEVDAISVTNLANYLLVSPGKDGLFQTSGCLAGPTGDDTPFTINSVNYNSTTFTATLNINNGMKLTNSDYQFYVCGTTSIIDTVTTKLNNGSDDTRIDFSINLAGTRRGGGNGINSKLPATGFAPGQVTALPEPSIAISGLNIRLEIPAIGVNAPVVGVADGGDVTWLGHDAGWLNGSAFPTWAGNSVITGHVWDADNNPGLFADLKTLKYGDTVLVHAFKSVYTYEVRDSQLVPPTDTRSVFHHEEQPWVTLLTCEDFNPDTSAYTGRRLVRAVLINVTPEK